MVSYIIRMGERNPFKKEKNFEKEPFIVSVDYEKLRLLTALNNTKLEKSQEGLELPYLSIRTARQR